MWCIGKLYKYIQPPVSSPFSLLLYTTPFSFFTYPLFYMSIPFPLNTVLLQVLQSGCNEKRNLVWNVLFTYWCLLSHNFLPIGMWDAPTLWWWMRFILRVIWWCWCSSFEFGHVVVPILHRLIKWRHLDGIVPANTTVFVFNSHPWHSFNILAHTWASHMPNYRIGYVVNDSIPLYFICILLGFQAKMTRIHCILG